MFVDAHCHIEMYGTRINEALSDLEKNHTLVIGVTNGIPSYERTVEAAERCRWILPAFGIVPHSAPEVIGNLTPILEEAEKSKILGEIGLDRFFAVDPRSFPLQEQVFCEFLKIAEKNDAILNIHSMGAEKEVFRQLDSYKIRRAIIHGFYEGKSIAQEAIDRGVFLSFGLAATPEYKAMVPKWKEIQEVLRDTPVDLILSETDAPGVTPQVMPTEVLIKVVNHLASAMNVDSQGLKKQIADNIEKLVDGIDPLQRKVSKLRR